MIGAIVAAGQGTRLKSVLSGKPKALLEICGTPMIDRVISSFVRNGISRIAIVIRTDATAIMDHVERMKFPVSIEFVQRDTKSGLFSFLSLEKVLRGEPFLLSTADVIYNEASVRDFMNFCRVNQDADMILTVTEFVMDEKPVYAQVNEKNYVTSFGRRFVGAGKFVSAGMYYCQPTIYREKEDALRNGIEHLSDYFGWIVAAGYKVLAFPVSKVIDVDDEEDIREAERFLECGSPS